MKYLFDNTYVYPSSFSAIDPNQAMFVCHSMLFDGFVPYIGNKMRYMFIYW